MINLSSKLTDSVAISTTEHRRTCCISKGKGFVNFSVQKEIEESGGEMECDLDQAWHTRDSARVAGLPVH